MLSHYMVMFFGITNSLATFQIMMNNIFRNLVVEGIVVVYLDSLLELWKSMHEWSKGYWRFWQSTSMSKYWNRTWSNIILQYVVIHSGMEYSTRKYMSQFTSTSKNISCSKLLSHCHCSSHNIPLQVLNPIGHCLDGLWHSKNYYNVLEHWLSWPMIK